MINLRPVATLNRHFPLEKAMILFIVFQPILDLLTSWMERQINIPLTIGIIIRGIVMILGFGYIVYQTLTGTPTKEKKLIFTYLIVFVTFFTISLGILLVTKQHVSLINEVKSMFKFSYGTILLFMYVFIFKKYNNKEKILQLMVINICIIAFSMLIAQLTNTALASYSSGSKLGHSGWFYAANELGAVIAAILPFLFIYAVNYTNKLKQVYYWIPILLGIGAALSIGTKVGYLSSVALLGCTSFLCILLLFFPNQNKPKLLLNFGISAVILVFLISITPYTPLAYNSGVQMKFAAKKAQESLITSDNNEVSSEFTEEELQEQIDKTVQTNLVFSSRDVYAKEFKEAYIEAPIAQKLFGMGFGSNVKLNKTTVEMDPIDVFYSFGIIGFLIYWLPYVVLAIIVAYRLITQFKQNATFTNYLTGLSIFMLLGISFIAGHVFSAPAVSIYIAILVAQLYQSTSKKGHAVMYSHN